MSTGQKAGIALGVLIMLVLLGWVFTAPYLSNQGLGRTPGLVIGGELTSAPGDFQIHNDYQGPLMFKQEGFPPFVIYLSWVATEDGIITATRPDGGYWAARIRDEGKNKGWLRLGDNTYAMQATEIMGSERIDMMRQWAGKAGRTLDETLYPSSEPLREWEVFYWTPQT